MKGIALDIETSGMDLRRSNVLEIGLVYCDLTDCGDIDQFDPKRDVKIHPCYREDLHIWPHINEGILWDPSTYDFHKKQGGEERIEYFMQKDVERCSGAIICLKVREFIKKFFYDEKPTLIGKNLGKFDWQFMNRLTNNGMNELAHHSFLDVGSLCFLPGKDSKVPNMETCMARYNIKPNINGHTAIADCHTTIDILENVTYDENVED